MAKRIGYIIIAFFFNVVGAWALQPHDDSSLIGKAAYDAVLPQVGGEPGSLMKAREGKRAVLVFWATWCPHCYEELGKINQVAVEVQNKDIKIILVDIGESKEEVKEYLRRREIYLPCFLDQGEVLDDPYQLVGIPMLVFIDEQGIIRAVTHRWPSDDDSLKDYFVAS